jgi:ribosomal protein S15P/S13E
MISLKEIGILAGIVGPVITGGVYVNDLRRDVAELGADYRQHVAEQQEVSLTEKRWKLESRVEAHPDDVGAKRELQEVNRLLDKNQKQQEQLKGGK